jgi:hypothetical protein
MKCRHYLPVRDFGFGLGSHNKRDCSVLINKLLLRDNTSIFVLKELFLGKRLFQTALQRDFFRFHLRGSPAKKLLLFKGTIIQLLHKRDYSISQKDYFKLIFRWTSCLS